MLTKLTDEDVIQLSLFDDWKLKEEQSIQLSLFVDDCQKDEQPQQLMQLVDKLNIRYSRDTLRFAAMGTTGRWQTSAQYRSNRWTTCWEEIPIVKC